MPVGLTTMFHWNVLTPPARGVLLKPDGPGSFSSAARVLVMANPTREQIAQVFQGSMFYEIIFTFGVPYHDPYDYAALGSNQLFASCPRSSALRVFRTK